MLSTFCFLRAPFPREIRSAWHEGKAVSSAELNMRSHPYFIGRSAPPWLSQDRGKKVWTFREGRVGQARKEGPGNYYPFLPTYAPAGGAVAAWAQSCDKGHIGFHAGLQTHQASLGLRTFHFFIPYTYISLAPDFCKALSHLSHFIYYRLLYCSNISSWVKLSLPPYLKNHLSLSPSPTLLSS